MQNTNTKRFLEIYKDVMLREGITKQKELCEKIGFSDSTFSQVLKGERDMPDAPLLRFCSVFGVNEEYVFKGKKPIYKSKELQIAEEATPKYGKSNEGIPLYPVNARAGQLIGFADDEYSELPKYNIPGFADCDVLVPVAGDSMYPAYTAGDIIACKRINQPSFIQWGHTHLIDTVQGLILKDIEPDEKNEGFVFLISENKKYKPIHLPKKEIKKIWIVKGKIKRNLI